ncbi:MAG: winged helix-turn-helix transcriptional regulator [Thermofilaceae archaeon]
MRKGGALALTALLGFLLICVPVKGQTSKVSITILDGGMAQVKYVVYTEGLIELTIPLVGIPDPSLLLFVTDEFNEPLAYELNNTLGTINVVCIDTNEIRISYYTQTLTYKMGKIWYVNFSSPYMVNITLPPNTTVTYLNKAPEEITIVKNSMSFLFEPGEIVVGYVFMYTPYQQPSSESQQDGVSRPSEQPKGSSTETKGLLEFTIQYAIVFAAILALVLIAVLVIRRKAMKEALEKLSEEDMLIINGLKKMGGGAFQSELQKVVNLPTTTLWRRLKRLEDMGLIIVEKRAGRNYIRLTRAALSP